MNQESISWGELALLTHESQVKRFNFCLCEDSADTDNPYSDCPKSAGNGERVTANESGLFIDSLGRFGYTVRMSGAYVCYTCGHLCECSEE